MSAPARCQSASAREPHSEHERDGERLQRRLDGYLAEAIRPNDGGILRGLGRSPARIRGLVLIVHQPGGFGHCGRFVDIHADHAAIRREGLPAFTASDMAAGELVAALQMAREVGEVQQPRVPLEVKPQRECVAESAAADENVATLPAARHTK